MKFFQGSTSFMYNWDQVAQGLWQRYPNPQSAHVLSEDTVSRKVISGALHTKRLLTKTNRLPKWADKLVTTRKVSIVEESVVDPVKKEICTYTRNVGLTKVMSIVEKVIYRPHPENSNWTLVERQAWVDSHIFALSYAIQKFGLERYRHNISKATTGFNHVLSNLFPSHSDSYTHLPEGQQHSIEECKHRLRDAAQRAKDIAKEKAMPLYTHRETVSS